MRALISGIGLLLSRVVHKVGPSFILSNGLRSLEEENLTLGQGRTLRVYPTALVNLLPTRRVGYEAGSHFMGRVGYARLRVYTDNS